MPKRPPAASNVVAPGPRPGTVITPDGGPKTIPEGWIHLKPGDAALTRRVKAAADHWIVQQRKGRKLFSQGIYAPAEIIEPIRSELEAEREDPAYARRLQAAAKRRSAAQAQYVEDFAAAVRSYLAFHPAHAPLADALARAVADHATPVGSGTVARTRRIPIEKRAEAAVIAWMRHQTTAYDSMRIPRVKGKRREVRRMLAARSKELLDVYRREAKIGHACPLRVALAKRASSATSNDQHAAE